MPYSLAIGLSALTLIVRISLSGWIGSDRPVLILFMAPIIFSAYWGGLGPGLLSSFICVLGTDYFLTAPIRSFAFARPIDLLQACLLLASGVLVSILNEALHRSRRKAADALVFLLRAEEDLRQSENLVLTVIENMMEGLVVSTNDGKFVRWNRSALQMHGFKNETSGLRRVDEFKGLFELRTADGTNLPFDQWPMPRVLRGETLRDWTVQIRRVGGDWNRIFSYNGLLARDPTGRTLGFLSIVDVTDRRLLEEQLQQAGKMEAIGQLAGGIAHDFNNLLTVINGYAEIVHMSLPEQDRLRDSVAEIARAGERAAALTSQLLAFGRKQVLRPRLMDLNATLREVEKMLKRLIGEDIVLETSLSPGLSRIKADPSQISQVVINMAVNARDAMPEGGRLTLETKDVVLDEDYCRVHLNTKPGRYALLAISDSGAGMSPDVQKRIFEPFFTTKEMGKGTGLGLATVFGIVEQSDGRIEVYSEAGMGSCFKIYLPAVDEDAMASSPDLGPRRSLGGTETILLVEDEPAVREIARLALVAQGYKIHEAAGGPEAIALIARTSEPIDLLLTDVVMPGMSGRGLAELLKARIPSLKVIYMSGYIDDAVVLHGILQEGQAFLSKPFSPVELTNKVRQVLDEK